MRRLRQNHFDRINGTDRIEANSVNPANPVNPVRLLLVFLAVALSAGLGLGGRGSPLAFLPWEMAPGSEETTWGAGGVYLRHRVKPDVAMFLWLYEWNLFDAAQKGEHTHGTVLPTRVISANQEDASVSSNGIEFRFQAIEDGARIELVITNRSDHDWPALAAIIPCFNPGPRAIRSLGFSDDEHIRTYFLGPSGLEPLLTQEIHFRPELRPLLNQASPSGRFVFTHKWPNGPDNAVGGILIRESADGQWVTGIAWEDFVSVQGHNPWKCMHLSVRVGPLPRGQTKTVRGRIYLFQGNREDCLAKYRKDFG